MTQDELIDMAKAAGFMQHLGVICIPNVLCLERFAELAAAPLQERIQDLYRQLNEAERELDAQYKLGMEAEREACAKMVEGLFDDPNDAVLEFIVDAIRARGQDA